MTPKGPPLVDELIVIDDHSTDATAQVAAGAGAEVLRVADILAEEGPGRGKGNVLWKTVAASSGDIVVWCDTDLTSFTPSYVTRLVAPLLQHEHIEMVKGFYDRPLDEAGHGGGRTTDLVATAAALDVLPGTGVDPPTARRRVRRSPPPARTAPVRGGLRRRGRVVDRLAASRRHPPPRAGRPRRPHAPSSHACSSSPTSPPRSPPWCCYTPGSDYRSRSPRYCAPTAN